MNIEQAFTHISARAYLTRCRYTYDGLRHFKQHRFEELPYSMQLGIIDLIWNLYKIQKMVYLYDLEYVTRCLMECGVKIKPFYDACEINNTFYKTRCLVVDREYRLMRIRLEIIRMVNRLIEYAIRSSTR